MIMLVWPITFDTVIMNGLKKRLCLLNTHMALSEIGNSMNLWIQPATMHPIGGDVMTWGMISWDTLGLLIPINPCLNATMYLSIVAQHVHCHDQNSPIFLQHNNALS